MPVENVPVQKRPIAWPPAAASTHRKINTVDVSINTNNMKDTNFILYTDVKYCNSESFLIPCIMRVAFKNKIYDREL